nr:hypothetical protein BaRGS_000439 [Batillaria attramentaria]
MQSETSSKEESKKTFQSVMNSNNELEKANSVTFQCQDYDSDFIPLSDPDGEGTPEIPHLTSSVGVRIVVEDSQDTNPLFTNQNLNFVIYEGLAVATELDSNGTRTQATATAQFTARILDIDDNGPEFAQANYRVEVQEMDGMTGIVQIPNLKIDVTDPDEPSFARFKVDVSSQSNAGAFGLTPDEITTGAASFYLTVNNFVHFDYDDPTYRTQIVQATDRDEGVNGELVYSIADRVTDRFAIDPVSGVIRLIGTLDYESQNSYSFLAFAEDKSDKPITSQVQVQISVVDFNDIGPQFTLPTYRGVVSEDSLDFESPVIVEAIDPADSDARITYSIAAGNTPSNSFVMDTDSGTSLLTLSAEDGDAGSNGQITYRIGSGARDNFVLNSNGVLSISNNPSFDYDAVQTYTLEALFGINQASGVISVQGTLDRDYVVEVSFVIKVEDVDDSAIGTQTGTSRVTITISGTLNTDLYFNPPWTRDNPRYEVGILESVPVNTEIITLQARDPVTGIVYLNGALDYEEGVLVRSVVVRAVQDTRSVTATVQITVEDENDESPRFTQITGNSAEILVKDKLDYEKIPEYDLDIYARDNANNADAPSNQARARVVISIIDENDNTPEFAEDVRKFSVAETAPPSTRLGQVLAKDGDFGLNGVIVYRLTQDPDRPDSNALNLFSVTSSSAIVVTQASLRGLSGIYYMTLVATDQGSPPNSASIPIEVKVQGAEDDDGTPQWLEPINNYVVEIYEHEPNTSLPVNLRAQPRTENATAIYEFSYFRNESVHFRINRSSGEIIVVDDLDREVKENYTLVVMAKDSKNTTLFSRRTILVRLLDKDDNDPLFKKNYAACPSDLAVPTIEYADDNTPNGTVITRAVACDPDSPRFSMMYYSLYLDNAICQEENVNAFIVTPDGYIVANKMLDYEERTEYLVCVEVSASAPVNRRRKRSLDPFRMVPNDTVGYFVIRIRDVNDQGPEFDKDNVVAVLQTIPSSNVVTKVTAIDRDGPLHNSVLYRIAETMYHPGDGSQPYSLDTAFRINPNNGIVSTNLPSYEDFADGYFMLRIVAQDYELSSLNDAIWLKIIVYKRSQILRVVLDMQPGAGRLKAPELVRTDICFVMVQNSKAYEVSSGVGLLDSRYEAVLDRQEYELVDRGACFPLKPSADRLKWVDLWWVLVAIAIFIFICCVILLVTIIILYDRYKDYMTTQRTYMVPQ